MRQNTGVSGIPRSDPDFFTGEPGSRPEVI